MAVIIKRYPNRKLYDTEAKRYVTLEEIARMIQNGREAQVVDNESGEDITNLTLTQIIFEQEKKGYGFLPRSVLTNLIRTSGETIDQVRRVLLGSLGAETEAIAAEEAIAHEIAALQQRVDELLHDILRTLNIPTNRELEQLQTQLDELNSRVSALLEKEQAVQQMRAHRDVAAADESSST